MSDTEIMKLEHQINKTLAISGNIETSVILFYRGRIESLKNKLKAAAQKRGNFIKPSLTTNQQ